MNRKLLTDIFEAYLDTLSVVQPTSLQLTTGFSEFMQLVERSAGGDAPPLDADDQELAHYVHMHRLRGMSLRRRAELAGVDLTSVQAKRWSMFTDLKSYCTHWACLSCGGNPPAEWRSVDGGLMTPFHCDKPMQLQVSVWCSKSTWHHLGSTCSHCGQKD
jgi:hypothetical protein